jgi:hypothetical protein
MGRPGTRKTIRVARAAESVRRYTRTCRPAHSMGLLPRPERLGPLGIGTDRSTGGAIRARISRLRSGTSSLGSISTGEMERESCGRRYRRGCVHTEAVCIASDLASPRHPASWRISLLFVNSARRCRARVVRILRGADSAVEVASIAWTSQQSQWPVASFSHTSLRSASPLVEVM